MKTQVIHLDIHDDFISIRDRMAWAKTPRILLVWPRRGKVSVRPLDITLLRRHAGSLGAELGIVTRAGDVRAAAREQGIPFFSTTAEAQKQQWREQKPVQISRRYERKELRVLRQQLPPLELFAFMASPVRRIAVFTAGVLAVLVVMLVFLPSANIQITPPEKLQSLTIEVNAMAGEQAVQISGLVPQHNLVMEFQGSDTALSSGREILPDQASVGEVVLMNLTEKAISFPSGAALQTASHPPVFFLTDESVSIPAGKGKTIRVFIHAREPGLSGNVIQGAITIVEGPLGSSLAVTNPSPVSGGTEISNLTPTEQDRASLKKRLLADLDRQARLRFASQIADGDVLLPATLAQLRILEETYSPPAGQTGEKLSLSLRVEYSIGYASAADLDLLAGKVLDASLPAGFVAAPGIIDLKMVSSPSEDAGATSWQMLAERTVYPVLDVGAVITVTQGKTVVQAVSLLTTTHGLAKSAQIKIQPAWWPWLPFLPMRITVSG